MTSIIPPDIHTHIHGQPGAVLCIDPTDTPAPTALTHAFSAAIHPWRAHMADEPAWTRLAHLLRLPGCVALGETGLDRRHGPDLHLQRAVMERQCIMARELCLPVIIHNVGCTSDIMALKRILSPARPWVIHGFRGKPQEAEQLLAHGFWLSLGERFNPASAAIIPADRLLIETDCSHAGIGSIAAAVALARGETTAETIAAASRTASELFGRTGA